MREERLLGITLLLAASILGACSGAQNSIVSDNINPPPPPPVSANTSQFSVTLSDAPPTGVSVLSFEVNITGALLQPTVGTDVSLLPGDARWK